MQIMLMLMFFGSGGFLFFLISSDFGSQSPVTQILNSDIRDPLIFNSNLLKGILTQLNTVSIPVPQSPSRSSGAEPGE
jgi:hypothetical protein